MPTLTRVSNADSVYRRTSWPIVGCDGLSLVLSASTVVPVNVSDLLFGFGSRRRDELPGSINDLKVN